MKIQYASDLHLEFLENRRYLKSHPLDVRGDVLILAGDITYLKNPLMEKAQFFNWASENFRQTLIVPGNHEFYGGCEMHGCVNNFEYKIRDNISYLNNRSTIIDHVEIYMTTLWSHIPKECAQYAQHVLNDFRNNQYDAKHLTIDIYNQLHRQSLKWLTTALKKSSSSCKIVVTHHCPTLLMGEPSYSENPMNSAFITELSEFIETHDIDYWICGHTHYNCPSVRIGKTTLVNNMLGYVEYEMLHESFRYDAILDL